MYPFFAGAQAVPDSVLPIMVTVVTALARDNKEWREAAVQLRDTVAGFGLNPLSQGAFLEAYGLFLVNPELYGGPGQQLAQLEHTVLSMHAQLLLFEHNDRAAKVAAKAATKPRNRRKMDTPLATDPLTTVFDKQYREGLHANMRESLPLHCAVMLAHHKAYAPSIEYALIVHDLLLEHAANMQPTDVVLAT